MQKVFSEEFSVRSYHLDAGQQMRISAVLSWMQEVSGNHLEQDGLSYRTMKAQGCVFLLTRIALWIGRLPRWGERVTVQTWFIHTLGAEYLRGIRFFSKNGTALVDARTYWVTADPDTHRILRPGTLGFLHMPETLEEDWPHEKIRRLHPAGPRAGRPKALGDRRVVYSDLDYNGHMNNAVYADIVCDFFPGGYLGRSIEFLQLEFLREALPGDVLHIRAGKDSGGMDLIFGETDSRRCFEAAYRLAPPVPKENGSGAGLKIL